MTRTALGSLTLLGILAAPGIAHALDPFEIQVYDGTANEPGELSLETHVNRVMLQRDDRTAPRDSHLTLETALGATEHLELGHYFQTALLSDGTFVYGGMKLRALLTTRDIGPKGLRLGLNFELGLLPERFDDKRWGVEMRPIVAWDAPHFSAAFNPIVGVEVGGGGLHDGASLEPCVSAYAKLGGLELGAEYYGELGTTTHLPKLGEQEHYAFLAGNAALADGLDLNAGVGMGLTEVSSPLVAKLIFSVSLGRLWGEPRADATHTAMRMRRR